MSLLSALIIMAGPVGEGTFTLLIVFSLILFSLGEGNERPVVSTRCGFVSGVSKVYRDGRQYDTFFGIPYAKPPTGDHRWRKPSPPESWNGTLDASGFSAHCIQYITDLYPILGVGGEHSEDCLYLNVYVPTGANSVSDLPVMVWFYGGGFSLGTAEMYPGEELALNGDVIVVTLNYRTGVMGFLTTGGPEAQGNFGLFDIALALQWVNDDIANFGGDPSRITLFGQSAGSWAVNHCMLSPYTNNLFQRGIALSGGIYRNLSMELVTEVDSAYHLAQAVGCPTNDTVTMVECMRQIDGEVLEYTANDEAESYAARPVVDNDFILEQPPIAWNDGAAKDIDYLTGSTYHDYAGFVLSNPLGFPGINYSFSFTETIESTYSAYYDIMASFTSSPESILDIMYDMYPDLNDTSIETRSIAATAAGTDFSFGSSSSRQAEIHSNFGNGRGNTYAYVYKHRNSFLIGYPDWVEGSHLDDIYSILGEPFMKNYKELILGQDFNDNDRLVKEGVMSYFANFAHTGNPNEGPHDIPMQWPQFNIDNRLEMHLSETMRVEPQSSERRENYNFWNDIWPGMLEKAAMDKKGKRKTEY